MSNRPSFVASAPAPSAAAAARSSSSQQPPFKPGGNVGCKISTNIGNNNNNNENNCPTGVGCGNNAGTVIETNNKDAGQLVAMSTGPRLNPHSALKEFNNYLLQVLDANDDEKREIISRLRFVVQAQRSAAAVREDLMKMTMEFNETARNAEELRLALQESREAQRRLEHENRVLAAQVEDDRAKIASLVKLCRAEMASKSNVASNALDKDDILLSVGNGRRSASSARNSVFSRNNKTATNNNKPTSVSLRAAASSSVGGSNQAEDGDSQNNQLVETNTTSNTTTDIVAQVLQGSANNNNGPDSLVVALRMESDALKQLIDEQRAAYESSRAAHVRVARDCDRRHYEEAQRMAAEIRSLSDVLVTSTKDLVETRQHANGMQRQLRGEIEGLVQRLAEAEKSKQVQSARQTEELRVIAASERNKNVSVTDRLRAKLTHNETKFHAEKETMQKDVEQYKEALAMAQETAARERRLRLRAEEHARLKSQGHESDLGLLRAQLRNLEKKAFFAHAKELQEYGSQPPANVPTEFVELAAPENEEDAMNMYFGTTDIDNQINNNNRFRQRGSGVGGVLHSDPNNQGEDDELVMDEEEYYRQQQQHGNINNSKRSNSGMTREERREAGFDLRTTTTAANNQNVVSNNNAEVGVASSSNRAASGRGAMRYDGGVQVAALTTGLPSNNRQSHTRSASNGSVQRPSSAMLM